jgi:hypothetical protein
LEGIIKEREMVSSRERPSKIAAHAPVSLTSPASYFPRGFQPELASRATPHNHGSGCCFAQNVEALFVFSIPNLFWNSTPGTREIHRGRKQALLFKSICSRFLVSSPFGTAILFEVWGSMRRDVLWLSSCFFMRVIDRMLVVQRRGFLAPRSRVRVDYERGVRRRSRCESATFSRGS